MIRAYTPADEAELREIHATQGHSYPFPDLAGFEEVLVAVEDGKIVQALAARKTVEMFMLGEPSWRTPAWRLSIFGRLHLMMHQTLKGRGYTDAHCWIPTRVERSFGRRLVKSFGWIPSEWRSFCRYL